MTSLLRALAVSALMPLAIAACSASEGASCPERFDRQAWRSAPFDSDRRHELAVQVERCGYLRGADQARVRKLLGPAERDPELQSRSEWNYVVGETNGEYGPADEQHLWIKFDKRGRVERAEVSPP